MIVRRTNKNATDLFRRTIAPATSTMPRVLKRPPGCFDQKPFRRRNPFDVGWR